MAEEPIKPVTQPVKRLEDAKNEVFEIWKDFRGRLVGFQVIGNLDVVASDLTIATIAHMTGHPMYIVQQQPMAETLVKAEVAKAKVKEEKASA